MPQSAPTRPSDTLVRLAFTKEPNTPRERFDVFHDFMRTCLENLAFFRHSSDNFSSRETVCVSENRQSFLIPAGASKKTLPSWQANWPLMHVP